MSVAYSDELAPDVCLTRACVLTGRSVATRYRDSPLHGPAASRPSPTNGLSDEERRESWAWRGL